MKITISNPQLVLDVQIAVNKEETHYYLQGFHVEKADKGIMLVSTDGHRMIVIHDPDGEIEGASQPVKLPDWFLKQLKSEMKRPDGKEIVIEGDVKTNSSFLSMAGTSIIKCDNVLIDGTFPDWRRVVPSIDHNKPFVAGAFSGDYFRAFAKLANNKQGGHVVTIGNDKHAPFLVRVQGRDDVFGVIMPCRWIDKEIGFPKWIGEDTIKDREIPAKAEADPAKKGKAA